MTTRQRVIVAMIDGLDPRYATPQAMPAFTRLASAGTSAEVEAVMPTVTNANNASIGCAAWPAEHGITGNYYYDPVSGEQDYMESSRLLLQPTLMTRVTDAGRYVRHHRTFGGTAWVWLNDPRDEEAVAATLTALPGIEAVLTGGDAARRFRLHPGRIGDLVVLGDVSTVFGDLPPGTESEALPVTYRSHGSLHERRVPLLAYNNQTLPYTSLPRYNKDLLQPLTGNWLRALEAARCCGRARGRPRRRRDRLGHQGRRTQVFLDQRSESRGILVGRRFSQLPAGSRCTITGMRAFVAVTNPEWYRFLSDPTRSEIPVVNFWKPGGGSFRALNDGEYFVFKAKAPINRVVGGGRYRGYVTMPVSHAWAQFGEANGAASLAELRRLIGGDKPIAPDEDPVIGCILVSDVTFVPVDLSFDLPPGWARSGIQQGKTYDMAGYDVAGYFADIMHIIPDEDATAEAGEPWEASGPMYGNPTLTKYRLRQNVFHAVVLNAYRGRCAITGSRIRPALQSAHIRPVASGGKNRLDNGLLLRSDVHAMFDGGYLGVDPAYRLRVSPRLRDEFGNGEQFYAQAGQLIALPEHRIDRPQRELLEWHLDEVFKAS